MAAAKHCLCLLSVALVLGASGLVPAPAQGEPGPTLGGGRAMPDYGTLELRGDGMACDTLALGLQAAARVLGREVDYETAACLTGNAFSLAINPNEDCASWWHVESDLSDRCLEAAARALGLGARPVPPVLGGDGEANMQALAANVRQLMDAGCVVLTTGGWDTGLQQVDGKWAATGPHGFVPWGWAGIITQANPQDGTILGAHPNGYSDNRIVRAAAMWALTVGSEPLSPLAADLLTLSAAIDRVRGRNAFARASSAVYGLDAMDLWIHQMETVPGFCASCQDGEQRGWTDALDNARAMRGRATAAAACLRAMVLRAPGDAHPQIQAAAMEYETIAALLAPSAADSGDGSCKGFVGDLGRQKAHATAVLRPARDALARAADAMELALVAMLPPSAATAGAPGGADGNEFVRGLEILLAQADSPTDYHTLMGDLGVAFILQATDQGSVIDGALDVGWWPLDPACLSTYLDFAGHAAGRRIRYIGGMDAYWAGVGAEPPPTPPDVRASIAVGRAVLANHGFWKVVTSYDTGKPPLLGFCPRGADTTAQRLTDRAWAFSFVGEPISPLPREQADAQALAHAVALGRDEVPMPDGFVTGQKAFALWARTLRDLEHLGQARWHANTLNHLILNRASAVTYLERMALRHPGPVSTHLQAAAGVYQKVLDQLRDGDVSDTALGSAEGRERLAAMVEGVAAMEQQAVDELQKAAEAMGPHGAE